MPLDHFEALDQDALVLVRTLRSHVKDVAIGKGESGGPEPVSHREELRAHTVREDRLVREFGAADAAFDREAALLEPELDELDHLLLVVDDEHRGHELAPIGR